MGKIERKYLAHFLEVSDGVFERLGKDLTEFRAEMSARVETGRNILGQTNVVISGYEKTAAVEPYYAEAGSALFEKLQSIIDGDLVLDALKCRMVEVKLWDGSMEDGYPAIAEEVYLEVGSYGGDVNGYQIPFTIHYTGNKVKGKFLPGSLVFTEDKA